jgi:L-histidine N-alpha-methyltransferase
MHVQMQNQNPCHIAIREGELAMAVREIARGRSSVLRLPAPPSLEWLELGGDDRTARFVSLNSDLSRPFNPAGDGKRIASGHAYTGNAVAWSAVCRDPLAVAQKRSVDTFAERWSDLRASAPVEPCHYVSLGPGDGRKDGVLLDDLARANRDLCYLPVDTSEELLHLAVRGLLRRLDLPADRVMSLAWDFSRRESVAGLRRLLDELFGQTPVLFSLLGNTIAHFDADADVLGMLAGELLRPGDRLLLEVEAVVETSPDLAVLAAGECAQSLAFGEFATSVLRHHTDLPAHPDDVELLGTIEPCRALLVKTIYRADDDLVLTLPNRTTTRFAFTDTIRLALSRKYSPEGLAELVADAGLDVVGDVCTGTGGPFGLALLMLEAQSPQ